LTTNPELQNKAMSLAQQLIAQGKMEGKLEEKLEGGARGIWTGKLQLLEKVMGYPPTAEDQLENLSLVELEARFRSLEAGYDAKFKQS
jgi:hypothetical protein